MPAEQDNCICFRGACGPGALCPAVGTQRRQTEAVWKPAELAWADMNVDFTVKGDTY